MNEETRKRLAEALSEARSANAGRFLVAMIVGLAVTMAGIGIVTIFL